MRIARRFGRFTIVRSNPEFKTHVPEFLSRDGKSWVGNEKFLEIATFGTREAAIEFRNANR